MRSRDGFLWLLMWAILGFTAVYVAKPPAPAYVVPEGVWQWDVPQGVPAIAWFGRLALAIAGAIGGGVVALILHNLSAAVRRFVDSRPGVRWMTFAILATLVMASTYLCFREWQEWIRR